MYHNNVIYLGDRYRIQTMNMTRKHIAKLKKLNSNDNDQAIALNEGALRSFYNEAINGPEAASQELVA